MPFRSPLDNQVSPAGKKGSEISVKATASLDKRKAQTRDRSSLIWTEKYRPKVPNDIIGNQSLVRDTLYSLHLFHLFERIICTLLFTFWTCIG